MEKIAQMALLADFYGPLLTEKQRNAWDLKRFPYPRPIRQIPESTRPLLGGKGRLAKAIFNVNSSKLSG